MEKGNELRRKDMRRKDREVTDAGKIREAIEDSHCCRLGFYDEGEVYIVPMNFGYTEEEEKRIFYFHSAKEGRKVDLISRTHSAGFELDTNYQLHEGEKACQYSAGFLSVIGTGNIDFVEDRESKKSALHHAAQHRKKQLGIFRRYARCCSYF
jgi:nitroimidazol reductase NimA-like FMN-containing flavoprotein (pyridoxamine 5'-phosphate oxidase superfamily)